MIDKDEYVVIFGVFDDFFDWVDGVFLFKFYWFGIFVLNWYNVFVSCIG